MDISYPVLVSDLKVLVGKSVNFSPKNIIVKNKDNKKISNNTKIENAESSNKLIFTILNKSDNSNNSTEKEQDSTSKEEKERFLMNLGMPKKAAQQLLQSTNYDLEKATQLRKAKTPAKRGRKKKIVNSTEKPPNEELEKVDVPSSKAKNQKSPKSPQHSQHQSENEETKSDSTNKWTEENIIRLLTLCSERTDLTNISAWHEIADNFPFCTAADCIRIYMDVLSKPELVNDPKFTNLTANNIFKSVDFNTKFTPDSVENFNLILLLQYLNETDSNMKFTRLQFPKYSEGYLSYLIYWLATAFDQNLVLCLNPQAARLFEGRQNGIPLEKIQAEYFNSFTLEDVEKISEKLFDPESLPRFVNASKEFYEFYKEYEPCSTNTYSVKNYLIPEYIPYLIEDYKIHKKQQKKSYAPSFSWNYKLEQKFLYTLSKCYPNNNMFKIFGSEYGILTEMCFKQHFEFIKSGFSENHFKYLTIPPNLSKHFNVKFKVIKNEIKMKSIFGDFYRLINDENVWDELSSIYTDFDRFTIRCNILRAIESILNVNNNHDYDVRKLEEFYDKNPYIDKRLYRLYIHLNLDIHELGRMNHKTLNSLLNWLDCRLYGISAQLPVGISIESAKILSNYYGNEKNCTHLWEDFISAISSIDSGSSILEMLVNLLPNYSRDVVTKAYLVFLEDFKQDRIKSTVLQPHTYFVLNSEIKMLNTRAKLISDIPHFIENPNKSSGSTPVRYTNSNGTPSSQPVFAVPYPMIDTSKMGQKYPQSPNFSQTPMANQPKNIPRFDIEKYLRDVVNKKIAQAQKENETVKKEENSTEQNPPQ
ncbi:hypothetical protein TVAG_497410 [Trichomonas vaginalis G3]|uniref:Uncharacterized protein n=1 Tax=Trichomonas vaginalis (strain ATCC PRA-98 / G3) TaxID=412133 RepID=A2EGY3_TRIV3|nr:hypothetical protein TVAGG3_0803370 [Trichomonas vaginalis G3]EAY08117.1 hypothetical protein TVAG_497410 [Trichomonas vaginalis G3]KAI5496668.1 hypothetical protein TVAGG3_0803370 [Trichomonas vaginalis G3]|eukprot:XP_001320340.1 hypothetical protein [Trichomonas vaginalis G3]